MLKFIFSRPNSSFATGHIFIASGRVPKASNTFFIKNTPLFHFAFIILLIAAGYAQSQPKRESERFV
jgi:hypothetical protein